MTRPTLRGPARLRAPRREATTDQTLESGQLFRDFAEASSDWFWQQDAELRYTYLSDQVFGRAGIRPADFLGKTRREVNPNGMDEPSWCRHQADLDARRPFRDLVTSRVTSAGRRRFFSISGKPVFDAAGRFQGYRGTGTDVTGRVWFERVLAGQNRVLELVNAGRPLTDLLSELCLVIEGLLVESACSFLLLDEATGCLKLGAAPNLPDSYNQAVDGVPVGPRVGSCGTAAFRREPVLVGDIATDSLWADYAGLALGHGLRACWSVPVLDATSGAVLGTYAVYFRSPRLPDEIELQLLIDASRLASVVVRSEQAQRERVEALTRERAARLETARERAQRTAIVEQLADAVLVADTDGVVVLANQAAGLLFGIDPSDIVGVRIGEQRWMTYDREGRLLEPDSRRLMRAVAGETVAEVFRVLTAHGQERWVWSTCAPLRNELGALEGAAAVIRDISDERNRQQQAMQSEKLRAVGQMASGVAHDLNQFLCLVAGHGELALRALDRPAPPLDEARESLGIMLQAAQDGAEAVKRLLAFSRPRGDEAFTRLNLSELLVEVAKLTAPRWRDAAQQEGRPIALEVEVDGDTTIEGSHATLREALTNLVFNAIDALPEGGYVRLAATRQGEQVQVEVSDSGVGMSSGVQDHLLEPFFTTKGERGTGLGLAMVYGAIERHQGRISVTSSPERGTTFQLSFPAAAPKLRSDSVEADPAAIGPLHILAVDDEPALGRMLALMLEPGGHDVMVASSAEQALELLAKDTYDLVISDLGMGGGMNGWDLALTVQERWPGLPLCLATGWGAQIDPEDARQRGVAGVISKPYCLDDLSRLLAVALA